MSELLRRLPAIDSWLLSEQGRTLCAEYSHQEVVAVMRSHLERVRAAVANGDTELPELAGAEYTALLRADLLARRAGSLRPVINATGIVIHTNLGRAPLAQEALEAIADVAAGYSNLEYDVETGERGSRNAHVEELLCELTGAEAALVVNNCASAVLLALRSFAGGGEVIVSRGELIEIGGSFRMPDVIAQSGARLVEVGTTNRTTAADYAAAVGDETRMLLMSHPSNYRIVGFTESPKPRELAALAQARGLVLMHDLGSGCLHRLEGIGISEPTVADCLAQGAHIVTFSGDKLLGGPQAGVVVGRAALVQQLRKNPLARALRIDKLSLAALAATLKLYRPPHDPLKAVPVLRMLSASRAQLSRRAARVAKRLVALGCAQARPIDGVSFAGGGSLPMHELPTKLIEIKAEGLSAQALAARLRDQSPALIGRISRDAVVLDLRTVLPKQVPSLIAAVRDAFR